MRRWHRPPSLTFSSRARSVRRCVSYGNGELINPTHCSRSAATITSRSDNSHPFSWPSSSNSLFLPSTKPPSSLYSCHITNRSLHLTRPHLAVLTREMMEELAQKEKYEYKEKSTVEVMSELYEQEDWDKIDDHIFFRALHHCRAVKDYETANEVIKKFFNCGRQLNSPSLFTELYKTFVMCDRIDEAEQLCQHYHHFLRYGPDESFYLANMVGDEPDMNRSASRSVNQAQSIERALGFFVAARNDWQFPLTGSLMDRIVWVLVTNSVFDSPELIDDEGGACLSMMRYVRVLLRRRK
eukprot:GHVN01051486.1.p1 GENE.GHVN01051486.1~~GHVN01051486.1.p1  ORF type:complete len:297 (+),score=42.38 GHVN01051486.1:101-991(+)